MDHGRVFRLRVKCRSALRLGIDGQCRHTQGKSRGSQSDRELAHCRLHAWLSGNKTSGRTPDDSVTINPLSPNCQFFRAPGFGKLKHRHRHRSAKPNHAATFRAFDSSFSLAQLSGEGWMVDHVDCGQAQTAPPSEERAFGRQKSRGPVDPAIRLAKLGLELGFS
jgi:hypothetical protein